jgi:hypothetical protein
MPLGSAIPIAVLGAASLMAFTAGATPKPIEPKPKPPAATPTAAAPPPAAPASAAPAHSAAPATSGSAAPAGRGSGLAVGRLEDRLEALRKRMADRKANLEQRRQADQERTRLRWGSVVDSAGVSAELKTHAEREARLERIQDLAEVEAKPGIYERARRALNTENSRHEVAMKALAGGAK